MIYFESTSQDYGTVIKIKCHSQLQRRSQTLDGEKCVNWKRIYDLTRGYYPRGDLYNSQFNLNFQPSISNSNQLNYKARYYFNQKNIFHFTRK